MHVVFRESRGLDETETPTDLAQSPADLVVLSLSDSDLGAFAAGWRRGGGPAGRLPSLRLANIAALKHPLSVDTYVEQTLLGARGVLIRLIGGAAYWPYGLQRVAAAARQRGIALAVLPGDGRPDATLDAFSTVPVSTLRRLAALCDAGGAVAAQAALAQLALAAGLYAAPVAGPKTAPEVGGWTPEHGLTCPALAALDPTGGPLALVTFYRSFLVAADLASIEALCAALRARGFRALGLFAPSLKAPDAARWLARQAATLRPAVIVNATSFSARDDDGASPLDAAGVVVFQVALATSTREAWAQDARGLSPADLAMHLALPEVDGRICAGVVSFRDPEPRDPDLQFSRHAHAPHAERLAAAADRVAAWRRLAATLRPHRRVALVLSTYPGRAWNVAHAVGLDAIASADAILQDLAADGYDAPPGLQATELVDARLRWPIVDYRAALAALPEALRAQLLAAWGEPEDDPAAVDGAFEFPVLRRGAAVVALQPERGVVAARTAEYHDLARTPRHAYVAFYLWLQRQADALIHVGAHGTLEWLPGKAVALSGDCWPDALTGALPVIYPFIVNDPGEAAQAKRRIGAVTLGHIPPPMVRAGTGGRLARLEALLDEFSNADGLDPRRRDRLVGDIRDEAQAAGVEDDLGLTAGACAAEAITRIDRFVCDIKESQFGDGLHVWGRAPAVGAESAASVPGPQWDGRIALDGVTDDAGPGAADRPCHAADAATCAAAESRALLDALDGRRIAPGPSGSPWRGRRDVLPTGRNLFSIDPRSTPTRNAHAQGMRLADELVRRHLQDHGDWPRGLVVDLWGSATMRTAGEEFSMALHLVGARPVWDAGSERVGGVEILPIAELDRPRIDVTLRVSGLFRDVFPGLTALFAQAVRALSMRDEAPDWNPFAAAPGARVYGPAPGTYGAGLGGQLSTYGDAARRAAGEAWLSASEWALDGPHAAADATGLRARVAAADAFAHVQDLPETDLLLAEDYAAHEAGFAAAQAAVGGSAALYHLDATDPARPRARALSEEVARVVRARAANPRWIAGMRRHGFRGAAEIAATLENLAAFAQLAGVVPAHLFDLYWAATLGDDETAAFMAAENPQALAAMQARFAALHDAGLWRTRRNAIAATLGAPS